MNKLFDLRFVIGMFFSVVGILLLLYSFFVKEEINQWCGAIFIIFGIVMVVLSLRKTAHDNLPDEN